MNGSAGEDGGFLFGAHPSTSNAALPTQENVTLGDVEFDQHGNSTQQYDAVTQKQTILIISTVTIVTAISCFLNGLVTVGIPVIALDLHLESSLNLWCVLHSI